ESEHPGRELLQAVDGGVVAEDVVAEFGGLHGGPHRCGRPRDGVAPEIDHRCSLRCSLALDSVDAREADGARLIRSAMRKAASKLRGSALPSPAMSKAVPWSGLVRTKGNPTVTLTPWSSPRYLIGMSPWSWYMAITTSNCANPRARMKTVSGACG